MYMYIYIYVYTYHYHCLFSILIYLLNCLCRYVRVYKDSCRTILLYSFVLSLNTYTLACVNTDRLTYLHAHIRTYFYFILQDSGSKHQSRHLPLGARAGPQTWSSWDSHDWPEALNTKVKTELDHMANFLKVLHSSDGRPLP